MLPRLTIGRIDLFLVDGPLEIGDRNMLPSRLSMWVPCATNRGGLPIPQLYERPYFSLFESLQDFFTHEWHFDVLDMLPLNAWNDERGAGSIVAVSYFLAASLWQTNLDYLAEEIKRIAFKDIRRPSIDINDRMHDRRQDLKTLQAEADMALTYLSEEAKIFSRQKVPRRTDASLDNAFSNILQDATELERFLMDTFQLLISSISILDAQASFEDAKRSTRLTQLATLYVPLSFITGIFGMNIKEINGGTPTAWQTVVGLVVIGACTAGALLLMTKFESRKESRKDRAKKYGMTKREFKAWEKKHAWANRYPGWRKNKSGSRESVNSHIA